MKKLGKLVVALVLVASVLLGCGANEEEVNENVSADMEVVEESVEVEVEEVEESVDEVVDFGQAADQVISVDVADIQVLNIDKSGDEMVLTLAIKNTTDEVLEVDASSFYIENINKTEEEPDDYDWSIFPTGNEFVSDISLVPGGMMIGVLGFESAPDVSHTLLINKTMDYWGEEFARVDLTTEVAELSLEATPDPSIIEATSFTVGEAFIPVEEVASVIVKSTEFIAETELTLEGQVNVRVDYSIENIGDTVVNYGFLQMYVYDYSNGVLRQQGTYPVLDDEIWIYSVEEGTTEEFFMCYQVTEGAELAVVFSDAWGDVWASVPLN